MNFLVVEGLEEIRKSLCYVLLAMGIVGTPASSKTEALKQIQEKDIVFNGAVVDIDSKDVEGISLIKELKQNTKTKNIQIIVHTIQSNREIVGQMMELGVIGYLLKPYKDARAYVKLKNILQNFEGQDLKRKHIRVKPDPEALLRIHFRITGYPHLISGKIIDISFGGIALELFTPVEEKILKPGVYIHRIEFTLYSKDLSPAGIIVIKREKILAIRFEPLSSHDSIILSKYIYKQISS